jgi:hypothetical protein
VLSAITAAREVLTMNEDANDIRNLHKIGDLNLEKGMVRSGVTMFAWDGVQECNPTTCPATEICGYIHRGKCAVQMNYLRALYGAILGTYKYLDDVVLFKIGMQIIPLYVMLVKMQITELSLDSPIYNTDKGAILPHPIYKEIRETLKAIHVMWKDLDITFEFGQKPNFRQKTGDAPTETGDPERGDPTYYKKLVEESKSQKGVIR